jgi:hypothetical protein
MNSRRSAVPARFACSRSFPIRHTSHCLRHRIGGVMFNDDGVVLQSPASSRRAGTHAGSQPPLLNANGVPLPLTPHPSPLPSGKTLIQNSPRPTAERGWGPNESCLPSPRCGALRGEESGVRGEVRPAAKRRKAFHSLERPVQFFSEEHPDGVRLKHIAEMFGLKGRRDSPQSAVALRFEARHPPDSTQVTLMGTPDPTVPMIKNFVRRPATETMSSTQCDRAGRADRKPRYGSGQLHSM